MRETKKAPSSLKRQIFFWVGLLLCILFGLLLLCNLTIIVKGTLHPEEPPSVLGVTPMVVLSGSMSGDAEDHIEPGDLIFVGRADPDRLKNGDIISFREEGSSSVVTHRIIRTERDEDGRPLWITKGDANNAPDPPVGEDRLVGVYLRRIPKVGDFALFLQTPLGMMLFVGTPLLAFILYDILRRQRQARQADRRTAQLEQELEKLRSASGSEPSDPRGTP